MSKSPAFQFYPKDWLGSTKVDLMTLAEQGAYLRLLCHAWSNEDCSLPNDDDKLSKLSRLNEGWFNGSSDIIKECFLLKGKRLVSERLLEERLKQSEWAEKCKRGGIESGKARRNKALQAKGSSDLLRSKDEVNTNIAVCSLQSSSSIASSKKNKDKDSGRFKKPSLEEVQKYITEKGYDVDAEQFIAHYEKVGWVVGKFHTSMKSWRSAVVTWKQNKKPDEGRFI